MNTATKRITAISVSQPWRMVVAVPSVGSTRAERLTYVYRYASEAEAVLAGFIKIESAYIAVPKTSASIRVPYSTASIRT